MTDRNERAAILLAAATALERHTDDVAGWLVREGEAIRPKAQFEVGLAVGELREAALLAPRLRGEVIPSGDGRLSIATRVPIGVVGVITPCTFPLILGMRSVAPALALGNPVILKPAPDTPVSGGLRLPVSLRSQGSRTACCTSSKAACAAQLPTGNPATDQRMYLQCDPHMDPQAMSDEEIWEQLQARVAPHPLQQGPIFQRDVLRFRSFVARRLRNERVALAGDSAHTVPPTGAKGMNLALADVVVLARALTALFCDGDARLLDRYEHDGLPRIWKAQHFSWWLTSLLHLSSTASDFDRLRQLGELHAVLESPAGRCYLAEAYTGWPLAGEGRTAGTAAFAGPANHSQVPPLA